MSDKTEYSKIESGSDYKVTSTETSSYTNSISELPAILGGTAIRTKEWPVWPMWNATDEEQVLKVVRSGVWSRADVVAEFERKWDEYFS